MMEFYCPQDSGGQMKFKLIHRDGEGLPRYAENLCLCFLSCEKWISVLWKAFLINLYQ